MKKSSKKKSKDNSRKQGSDVSKSRRKKTSMIKQLKNVVSDYMNKKIVTAGVSYENLLNAFETSNEFGIIYFSMEKPGESCKK